mmetsp:Transcript_59770/g.175346  ORF Transcript_59770/g.175346 Transcript_59770/m.175346 type:complete len:141 (-) Transcript_59770:201-623(-)
MSRYHLGMPSTLSAAWSAGGRVMSDRTPRMSTTAHCTSLDVSRALLSSSHTSRRLLGPTGGLAMEVVPPEGDQYRLGRSCDRLSGLDQLGGSWLRDQRGMSWLRALRGQRGSSWLSGSDQRSGSWLPCIRGCGERPRDGS